MKKIKIVFNFLNKKEKKSLLFIFFLSIIASLLEVFSIAAIIPVIGSVFAAEELNSNIQIFSLIKKFTNFFNHDSDTTYSFFIFLGIFLLKNIYLMFFVYIKNKHLNLINFRISEDLLKKYLNLPYQFLLNSNSIKIIKNVEEITSCVGYIENLLNILTEIFLLILFLFFLSQVNFKIVFYSIAFFIFFGFILKYATSQKIKKIGYNRFIAARNKASSTSEIFQLYKEIKIYNKEAFFINIFDKNNRKEMSAQLQFNIFDIVPKLYFETLFVILIVFFLIFLKTQNFSSVSIVMILGLFGASAYRIMPAINKLFRSFQMLRYTFPPLKTVYDHLNLSINDNFQNKKNDTQVFEASIEIKNLSFRYNNSEKEVFRNLNFLFSKKKVSGILGSSGSGKSTLLNLITGFLHPSSGEILSGNNSIFNNIDSWRSSIGYVSQESAILDTTIIENIAFGLQKNEIDNKKIEKVLKLSNLSKFVKDLPMGLHTECGERGNNISGGQKQRLCIARALYFNRSILILDEATNALDKKIEKEIFDEIISLKDKIKIIIITHNPDSIKYFDEILNLND